MMNLLFYAVPFFIFQLFSTNFLSAISTADIKRNSIVRKKNEEV